MNNNNPDYVNVESADHNINVYYGNINNFYIQNPHIDIKNP